MEIKDILELNYHLQKAYNKYAKHEIGGIEIVVQPLLPPGGKFLVVSEDIWHRLQKEIEKL